MTVQVCFCTFSPSVLIRQVHLETRCLEFVSIDPKGTGISENEVFPID